MADLSGTRDAILTNALRLFARKGYAAVSMRDVAGAVGIRASTIYYYFPAKQDIFSELVRRAEAVTEDLKTVFLRAFEKTQAVREASFVDAGRFFLEGYLWNEKIEPLLRTLESERFHNEEADAIWKRLLFSVPLEHEERVFEMLSARGEVVGANARALAAEYHGLIMMGYFTGDVETLQCGLSAFYRRTWTRKQAGGDTV